MEPGARDRPNTPALAGFAPLLKRSVTKKDNADASV
jgi:hypothetical protein